MARAGPFTHDGVEHVVDDDGQIVLTVPEHRETPMPMMLTASVKRMDSQIVDMDREIESIQKRRGALAAKVADFRKLIEAAGRK
jgi:hypothetical protein